MTTVIIGVLGLAVGLLVCLRGYRALRVIITVLGAWYGFVLGGRIAAAATGEEFLATPLGWVGAIVGALVLGLLAYAIYQLAVLIGMGSLGLAIASTALTAFGVENETVVWVVSIAAALLLVVLALVTDLPAVLLVVLTALAGAGITISGVLLLLGSSTTAELGLGTGGTDGWWSLAVLGLAVVGMIVQSRDLSRTRMRAAWGGREVARA